MTVTAVALRALGALYLDTCLGDVDGSSTDWTHLQGRDPAFAQDMDTSDPWQFKNFQVT